MRIGDMLVKAGLLREEQLKQALASQKESGRKLGEELVHLGLLTEVQVTQVLSNQLALPWVSLYHVEFSRDLLRLVPAEVADRFCAIPIYVRQVRREGDTLFVAMDDPTNEEALLTLREITGMPVKAMVAPPTDIRNAIQVYYFGARPEPLAPVVPMRSSAPPSPKSAPPAPPKPVEPAPTVAAAPKPAPEVAQTLVDEQAPMPEPVPLEKRKKKKSAGPRFVTLTLLDGTSVRLPAPAKAEEAPRADEGLTARDVVNALLAKAHGQDVSAILPDGKWEVIVATVLTLLLRKGLVADWEFVAELEKARRG